MSFLMILLAAMFLAWVVTLHQAFTPPQPRRVTAERDRPGNRDRRRKPTA